MYKFLLLILGNLIFFNIAFPATQKTNLVHYRSETELLSEGSKAIEMQGKIFSKSTSFDETGSELAQVDGDNFSVNDWTLKYSQGIFLDIEASLLVRMRSVKSETSTSSASQSGLESFGIEGKYLFFATRHFKHALGLRFKKTNYTNLRYPSPEIPPSTEVVLGDDGNEMGADYLVTYFDKYLKYDFKIGHNKPAKDLSSEIPYKIEIIYDMEKTSFLTGLSGIYSLKNDTYTDQPLSKPAISTGNSRLFNSINREQNSLFAGVQYAIGNFVIGLKGESVLSGSSTDKGHTIAFNIRWEDNLPIPKVIASTQKIFKSDYFAEGFVEDISSSQKTVKINIGADNRLVIGTNVDVFSIHDYSKGREIANGVVVKIGPNWAIITIDKNLNQSSIHEGDLVRAYEKKY